MSLKSTAHRYGSVAIVLHWVSAIAILALFGLGFAAANTGDAALKAELLRFHVPLGALVVTLTVLRLIWRLFDRRPASLSHLALWQAVSERLVHALLYLLILVMGASGTAVLLLSGAAAVLFFGAAGPLADFWAYAPMAAHFAGAMALLGLAALHILAALYHQFYRRDGLMARMWT